MGRPAKSINLHAISGNKAKLSKETIKKRKQAEEQMTFKDDAIEAPSFLSDRGKKIFENLLVEFQYTQILKNVDSHLLGLYCDALDNYIRFKDQIEREGFVLYGKAHPLLTHMNKALDNTAKLGGRLGLSPSDRAKLALNLVNKVKEETTDDNGFGDRT
ncbi:phage terminase small subunit P27 family [Alkalihalobacillus clausii]|nr:phage terminase small subunit P27 family [Shouchella clausii]